MPIRAQQKKVDSTKNANHFLTRPENNGAKQGEDIINVYSNFLTHAFVIFSTFIILINLTGNVEKSFVA